MATGPMELTAVLTPAEEGGYGAFNPETGTTTEGESIEEALANLREATSLDLEEFPAVIKGHPLVSWLWGGSPEWQRCGDVVRKPGLRRSPPQTCQSQHADRSAEAGPSGCA